MMTLHLLENLFPEQIQERLNAAPILVLPFGTIEWHSYHLPLGLDGIVAQSLAERIAERTGAVLAPVSYWAVGGVPFPYTLKLPTEVIEPLLTAVFEQFAAMNFRVIVAFTGHFGLEQTITLKRSAVTVMRRSPVTILPLTEYDFTTDLGYRGDHAGVGETSLLWALRPELVRLEKLPHDVTLDGVIGDDLRKAASQDYGRRLADAITTRTAQVSIRLLTQTSPLQRASFIEAIAAGVRVLERVAGERLSMPKKDAPPVATPAYLSYCQALYDGDYCLAKSCAEQKLAVLSE